MAGPHSHASLELNYLAEGAITFLHQGHVRPMPIGQLLIFSGIWPHAILDAAPGSRFYVFAPAPFSSDLPGELLKTLFTGRILGAKDPHDQGMLERWVDLLSHQTPLAEEIVRLEMRARILRFLPFLGRRHAWQSGSTDDPRAIHLQRMLTFIHTHFQQPIDNAAIAAAAGLNPRYAVRLFREKTRFSLNQYLTRVRLAEAQRLLLLTDRTTDAVAMESGFLSLSRFYQAFQEQHSQAPAAWRRQWRGKHQSLTRSEAGATGRNNVGG